MDLLKCHEDAYLDVLEIEVLRCEPRGDYFEIQVSESIFFPGGGGQPQDLGHLGGRPILDVSSVHEDRLVYLLDAPVPLGSCDMSINWARRFDHMQQHTGQHLITALAVRGFGWPTRAFHLNPTRSDVVLDAGDLTHENLRALEDEVNEAIRAAKPVTPRQVDAGAFGTEGVRSRRQPVNHKGSLRCIDIEGIDLNTCGGTHVRNTAELQLVRFTEVEWQGSEARCHFLVGNRVMDAHRRALRREKAFNELLSCGPAEHFTAVERMRAQHQDRKREVKRLRKEVARLLGGPMAAKADPLVVYHRRGADAEFLHVLAKAIRDDDAHGTLFLTAEGEQGGFFLLDGPEALIAEVGPAVAAALSGRGGGRGGRFQGQAGDLSGREEAEKILAKRLGTR